MLRAVLFDVDCTPARPGPELGPDGYVRAGERHGLRLEAARYEAARDAALVDLRRHPELEHDDEIWFRFTERIVRGMGGDADSAYDCAIEITRGWERHENFELYDDVPDALGALEERSDQVDRRREDDRRRVAGTKLEQRLQVAQLQGDRVRLDHDRRVLQLLGRLELALGVDDLRAPLALGLRLTRHGALHAARDLDVLHLDDRDLDSPGPGRLVDDPLQDLVDLLALGEQLVERVLAEHRPQGRLRDLGRRDHVVLDLHDRALRVDDLEVRDRVHPHRHVVLGDDLLRRDVQRDRAEVDLHQLVDDRDLPDEPGAARRIEQPAPPEEDGPLVLPQDTDKSEHAWILSPHRQLKPVHCRDLDLLAGDELGVVSRLGLPEST